MRELFLNVLNISVYASVLVMCVLIIRVIMYKKVTKNLVYVMWIFVFMRFLLPFQINMQLSIYNLVPDLVIDKIEALTMLDQKDLLLDNENINGKIENVVPNVNNEGSIYTDTAVKSEQQIEVSKDMDKVIPIEETTDIRIEERLKADVSNSNTQDSKNLINESSPIFRTTSIDVISSIWFAVVLILLSGYSFMYFRMRYILKETKVIHHEKMCIYQSVKVESPILYGLIHPKLIVPIWMDCQDEAFRFVLEHEEIHIHRRDYLIKPIFLCVSIVYWFVPFVWIAYYYAIKDMEMSCDELVIKKIAKNERIEYANTLLDMSMKQNGILLKSTLAFGEKNTKARIKHVVYYEGISKSIRIIGLIIAMVILVLFCTNSIDNPTAIENKDKEQVQSQQNKNVDQTENTLNQLEKTASIATMLPVSVAETSEFPLSDFSVEEIVLQWGYKSYIILDDLGTNKHILAFTGEDTTLECSELVLVIDKKNNRYYVDQDFGIRHVRLNEALDGYVFYSKFRDFTNANYIVGIREKYIDGKSYSNIVCIPKNNLQDIVVLEEYIFEEMSQSVIPTIMDFTLQIKGDYLIYEDVDSFWKVRHITSDKVFASEVNSNNMSEIVPIEGKGYNTDSNKYIEILRFTKDNSFLVFNKENNIFEILGKSQGLNPSDRDLLITMYNSDGQLESQSELMTNETSEHTIEIDADVEDYLFGLLYPVKKDDTVVFESNSVTYYTKERLKSEIRIKVPVFESNTIEEGITELSYTWFSSPSTLYEDKVYKIENPYQYINRISKKLMIQGKNVSVSVWVEDKTIYDDWVNRDTVQYETMKNKAGFFKEEKIGNRYYISMSTEPQDKTGLTVEIEEILNEVCNDLVESLIEHNPDLYSQMKIYEVR